MTTPNADLATKADVEQLRSATEAANVGTVIAMASIVFAIMRYTGGNGP